MRIPAMARRRVHARQDSFCFRDGMDIVLLINVAVSRSFWCKTRSEDWFGQCDGRRNKLRLVQE